jgi:hypothetical protein
LRKCSTAAFRQQWVCASDRSAVAAYVNEGQERLITDPMAPEEGWWGGYAHMLFNLAVTNFTGSLITPREIARIDVLDICTRPRRIRNGFYEYLQFGTGHKPRPCNPVCSSMSQAFDRDNVPTLIDFPTSAPQFIRIYPTNANDVGKRVLLQGLDKNGMRVIGLDNTTSAAISGELVNLGAPFVTSLNEYQTIDGIMKDPTLGPVTFFTVDPVSGSQTQLSSMEPSETTASYRKYLFDGIPPQCCNTPSGTVQVDAQCKLDFIPVLSNSDYLIIQSIPALTEEVQAIRYSRMDSTQAAAFEQKHHVRALQLLNGQIDHFEGKTRTAISLKIFGSDRLRPQPI